MGDNGRISEGSGAIKNRFVEYRREVNRTKNFEAQLNQAAQPAPSKTVETPKASAQVQTPENQAIATQKTIVTGSEDSPLASGELSPKMMQYMSHIKQAAARYNLPPELIAGIIWQESRGNSKAVSHCGAQGLMQLMPETARHLGVKDPFDPAQNIEGGSKYIRQMLDRFGGNAELAVAAYNSGPGNVEKYGRRIPPFRETQEYVPRVLGYASNFKASGIFSDSPNTMRA